MITKFRAAIWDLDGTLIDSLEDIGNAMNRVLNERGLPEHHMDAYRIFIGDGIEKLVFRAFPESHREKESLDNCISAMRETYLAHMLEKTKPYPGMPDVIETFKARGFKQAVLSNKPDLPTQRIVSAFFPNGTFEIVTGARPDIPKKPDPTAAVGISDKIGISPEDFLYFGDTGTDMKTAVAAGMFPVGVLWGFRGASELLEGGARMLVKTPLDLRDWLRRI